jgi:stage II sporulation protein D
MKGKGKKKIVSILAFILYAWFFFINPSFLALEAGAPGEAPPVSVRLFGLFGPQELYVRVKNKNTPATLETLAGGQKRTITAAHLMVHPKGIQGILEPAAKGSPQQSLFLGEKIKLSSPGGLELSPNPQKLPFRPYKGSIMVSRPSARTLLVLEEAALEDYTAGVVAAEMADTAAAEAQKAQAVLARTFALRNRGRHEKEGYDLCDTTHCQLYQGSPASSNGMSAERAARATRGQVLYYRDKLAFVYYHSTCGGRTADESDFPQDLQALGYQSVVDQAPLRTFSREELCRHSPHAAWEYSLSLDKIQKALAKEGWWWEQEVLQEVTVARQGLSGRATRISLRGKREREIDAWDFRNAICRAYGWSTVKSSWFSLERKGRDIIFRGRGLGHGLGLCQYGALELSRQGFNYREILRHYYPGFYIRGDQATRRQDDRVRAWHAMPLQNAAEAAAVGAQRAAPLQYAQSEHFTFYYSSPGEENQILPLLEEAYNTLKTRYGYRPRELVKVTFYASTESYCRATGQPWWLGAVTTQEGMHFQPLAVLQKKGGVSTYILHEYTHWMVQDLSKGRSPYWLSEGLALLESGEGEGMEKELNSGRSGVTPRAEPRGETPSLQEIEEGLRTGKDKETLRQYYYEAYKFTRRLEERFGRKKMIGFLIQLGQGVKEAEAGKRVFGEGWEG